MYNVYFEDKVISFLGSAEPLSAGCAVVNLSAGDADGITKVLEKLENSKRVCVKTDNLPDVYTNFCDGFLRREAAGGLVANSRGEVLMIFRNGKWDLPKGHLDEGESPVECAVREVKEECGLENVAAGRLITCTDHIYNMWGGWTMKHTSWYAMTSDDVRLTPQTGEGITVVEWVPATGIAEKLAGSYSTIAEVFRAAGIVE